MFYLLPAVANFIWAEIRIENFVNKNNEFGIRRQSFTSSTDAFLPSLFLHECTTRIRQIESM